MFRQKQHVDVKKSAQKVLEGKRDSVSRLKHLRVYLDNVDTAEAKLFFELNYSHIYCAFHDVFTCVEGSLKQRVHKAQKEELDNVKYIFERILVLLPELLARRWQWHSVRIILCKFLHPANSAKLRREGIRLFLLWYQILGEGAPSDVHAMFLSLVPGLLQGSPAASQGSGRTPESFQDSTFYTSVDQDSGPVVPGDMGPLLLPQSGESQPENATVTYLECLMEFMVTQVTKVQWGDSQEWRQQRCFEFLFENFKKHFLPHIFPDFCFTNSIYKPNLELPSLRQDKKMAAPAEASAVPPQCRSVVVQWIVNYTQPAKLRKEDVQAAAAARKQELADCGERSALVATGGGAHESQSGSSSSSSSAVPSLSIGSLSERDSDGQLQQTAAQAEHASAGHRSLTQTQVVRNVLYSKRENVNLVHEVLRQAFLAPFSQSHTTKNVIYTYRDWIQMVSPDMPPFLVDTEGRETKDDARNAVTESNCQPPKGAAPVKRENVLAGVQNVYQVFITNAANVFLLEVATEERTLLDEQVELCKRVMNIYRYMVMKQHMDKATWEQLLVVLLRVTSLVLKTTPPSRKEEVLGGRLAPALFQTLIVTWIKANLHATISLELWDGFLNVLSSLTQWEELIREWAKTMETLTRILAQHVYRLNLADLPLQRQQQHRRRRGLKHHHAASNPSASGATAKAETGRGDNTGGGGAGNATAGGAAHVNGVAPPSHRASPSLADSREGSRESGVPPSPRLRTGSVGQRSCRTEDEDRNADRARCNSGDSSLPSHQGDRASEKPPLVIRCYSDGHLLLHKVERLRRNHRARAFPAQDRFDIASVSSDSNVQSDSRQCPLTRSKSLDYLSLRVESPCMSHASEYRSRSPSPTPSSGLESTSIKDSPIQIDVLGASSDNACNAGDADVPPGTDRRSVLAGGGVKGWLPEVAVVLWRRMLGALGNVNAIRDPAIHAQVMEHLIDLSETLVKMRENLGVTEDNTATPPPPQLIPPLLLIAPWLFEAQGLPEGYERGKLLALRLLCWLTVRRHDVPLSFDLLARFYNVLHTGLLGEDQKVINAIVKYCGTKFFASKLPGHTVLLLNFVHGAGSVVSSNVVKGMPRVEAVTLLGSLVCFPNIYRELQVLQCQVSEPPALTSLTDVKERILGLLLKAGRSDPDGLARCNALCALAIFAYEELSHQTNHPRTREAIGVLLISIRHYNPVIAQVAGDNLRLLCDHAAYLTEHMAQVPGIVIEVIAATLHSLLPTSSADVREESKKLVLSLLFCLADWCMHMALPVLTRTKPDGTSPLLCTLNVLEHVLTGRAPSVQPDVASLLVTLCPGTKVADTDPQPAEIQPRTRSSNPAGSNPGSGGGKIARSIASFVPPAVLQSDLRRSGSVKLAARMILSHLLHQLGHFPMGLGAAQLTSLVGEQDDVPALRDSELSKEVFSAPNIQLFVLNNAAIISLVEIPAQETPGGAASVGLTTGKSQVRAIVRDLSGKFAWDCLTLYGPHGCRAGSYPPGPVPDPCLHYTTQRQRNPELQEQQQQQQQRQGGDSSGRRSPLHRPPNLLPLLDNTQENYDNLDDLLQYVGHTSPECVQTPCQPLNSAPKATHELAGIREAETIHLVLSQHSQEGHHTARASYSPEMLARAATPPNPTEPLSPFQYSRLLLENFNFFAWEKRPKFDLVKKNEKLLRELRNLDNQMCRETHKIAVIYVAEGQEDKNSIFMNSCGSRAFEEFVSGLGWEIDLEMHTGYNGGLEANRSTGSTAPYCATSFMEVVFHVSTRIPAIEKDSVTKKLRHLGNDEVHIVWSEHTRDYRRGIIPTEFCDVLIVIYPLGNWLYRIQINPKPEVPFFGPLFDGAIVDHVVLPRLVRATAINAGRAVNSLKPMFRTYYEQRAQALETIVQNYKEPTSFEEFASKVLAPAPAKSPLQLRRSAGPAGAEGGSPSMGSTLAAALLDSDSGSSPHLHHHFPRPRPATVSTSAGEQGSFPFTDQQAMSASQSHSSPPVPN
ncbi:ral GTPase-activating protein subunit alpha-1 [Ixodes scapularis]|uniref:ral GTPase-activating protein subunit alpha-1 n=1 Tax=Ixodes scapularis TaxID=6945 RepID=UPI001C38678B|nr:ral GTPase-activating protein subunit alpha-1 [Ixodes scapularis]